MSRILGVGRQDFKAELSALEIVNDVQVSLMDQITPEMQQFFPDVTPLFHEGDPANEIRILLRPVASSQGDKV